MISKLTEIGFSIYGPSAKAPILKPENFKDESWVAYDENLAQLPEMRWLASNVENANIRLISGSALSLANAIRAGVGIGILPCQLGDSFPDICRLSKGDPIVSREAWLLLNKDLKNAPRVRHFVNWLKKIVLEYEDQLSGKIQDCAK